MTSPCSGHTPEAQVELLTAAATRNYCSSYKVEALFCLADRVAMLDDLQAVLGVCRVGKSRQLAQDLNYRRAGELPPLLLHPLGPDRQSESAGVPPSAHISVTTPSSLASILKVPSAMRRPKQFRCRS